MDQGGVCKRSDFGAALPTLSDKPNAGSPTERQNQNHDESEALSHPKDESFNDNVKVHMMDQVAITTARQFSFAVVDAGKGARLWEDDLKDAYKNLPARPGDTRLQGFT